jgi:hypothetical protein
MAERLRLAERGEENGKENRPQSSSKQLDRVETETTDIAQQEYARAVDIYRQGVENYDRRIYGSAIETLGVEIVGAAQHAVSEYIRVAHQATDEIGLYRKNLNETEKEYEDFRAENKLTRGCRSPHGHVIHIGVILLILLVDSIVNGYFLSSRNEFGLLGGVMQAIIVAGANILLGWFAGWFAIPNFLHKSAWRRLGGFIALAFLLAVILGLNLSFAHYRDVFTLGLDNPEQRALAQVIEKPFILHDVKSWWLAGIGLIFSVISLIDGYKWDDPYPGYGDVSRRRDARREEYQDAKHVWLTALGERREQARAEVGEIRHNIDMMQGEIQQAGLGRRNFTAAFNAHLGHLESAANQLLDVYRDANRRARSTPMPDHFEQRWRLTQTEFPVPHEIDRDQLKKQIDGITAALSDALTTIHETHDKTIGEFDRLEAPKPATPETAQQLRLVG